MRRAPFALVTLSVLLLVPVGLLGWDCGSHRWVERAERSTEIHRLSEFGAPAPILEAGVVERPNASALEFERLTAIGLGRGAGSAARVMELERTRDPVPEPYPFLSDLLDDAFEARSLVPSDALLRHSAWRHEGADWIAQVVELLVSSEPPTWEYDTDPDDLPTRDLGLGFDTVHGALLLEALYRDRILGSSADARDAMTAARRSVEFYADKPDLLSTGWWVRGLRDRAIFVRLVGPTGLEWAAVVDEPDPIAQLVQALRAEGRRAQTFWGEPTDVPSYDWTLQRLLRVRVAEAARALESYARELRDRPACQPRSEGPCPPSLEPRPRLLPDGVDPADFLRAPGVWDALDSAVGAEQAMLQWQLTRLASAVVASVAEDGELPESLPGGNESYCPGETWLYERHADGTFSITHSKPWGKYPLEYRSGPGEGAPHSAHPTVPGSPEIVGADGNPPVARTMEAPAP